MNATGIVSNVTAVNPTAYGYLTVFPADAPQAGTSNLNWVPTSPPTPNQVTVGLSATGAIKAYNNVGVVDVIIDIVGYYQLDAAPARVVTVASANADFTSVKAALASITDASATNPYLITVAPGVYTETGGIDLKDFVDIQGAGEDVTTITAAGSAIYPGTDGSSATVRATGAITAQVRLLTIKNTGLATFYGTGIRTGDATGSVSFTHVTALATGGNSNYAIFNHTSSPLYTDVTSTATGVNNNYALYNETSSPIVRNSTLTGVTYSVFSGGGSPKIVDTQLVGPRGGATNVCVGDYDGNFAAIVSATC